MFSSDMQWRRLVRQLLVAGFLLLFFYLSVTTAVLKAPATDEPLHLLRAVLLRQSSDLTLQGEHPPLSHRLIGIFLDGEQTLPEVHQLSSWDSGSRLDISQELLWQSGVDVERTFVLARMPIILAGVLTGALVAVWALSWHGELAMLVALALFTSSPNLIANAALATTDFLTVALIFATIYMWWRYGRHRQKRWWALTAILMGLALATKLSTIILLPVTFAQLFLFSGLRRNAWRAVSAWLAMLPLAALSAWGAYGFENASPGNALSFVPAPTYWQSWSILINHVESGHPSFFWGALSSEGWWFYFPVTFLIKTPLFSLLLLLLSLFVVLRHRKLWPTALFLLMPVGALIVAAIFSRLNIGYRHILPIVPFLLVFSSTAVVAMQRRRATRAILGFGLVWSLLAVIWQHPHHLAYFNEAVGGMAQGYHYLGDSNLDWGQDVKLLAQTVAERGGTWRIAYYGPNDPAYYGLPSAALMDPLQERESFPAANPPPGSYAISASYLQGQLPDPDYFAWFQQQKPVEVLGGSILVFNVAQQARGTWIAHCPDSAPLLTTEEAESLLDSRDARHIYFDCEQSFVLPAQGVPGWYVLPTGASWWFQDQIPALGERLHLAYRHRAAGDLPFFDVFYWPGGEGLSLAEGWMESAETVQGDAISLPRQLNALGELVAYLPNPDSWSTLWLVTSATVEPLSLQAHLHTADASSPQVADSLGFSSAQWQPGDWFVQRHHFANQDQPTYLQTGMYNYLTLEQAGERINLPARVVQP